MYGSKYLSAAVLLATFLSIQVAANWDPATGHLRDFRPTDEWLATHNASRVTKAIQVAECATNTRLAFPEVQLFAYFSVDHACDAYHGCPYGTCYAYTVFPQPDEFVVDFTNSHCFFWHNTGGIPGTGTNPIANPQTGGFGYESSLDGVYHDGKLDTTSEQRGHDNQYPGFRPDTLPKWTQEAREKYATVVPSTVPTQPKCGRPNEPNKDPGSVKGAFGGYKPRPASDYQIPNPFTPAPPGGSVNPPPGGNHTQPGGSINPPPGGNHTHPGGSHNPSPGGNHTHPGGSHNPPPAGNHTQPGRGNHGKKPKHHGHQGHGGETQPFNPHPKTNHTKCTAFCECIGGCSQADTSCHGQCQDKHPACTDQVCQAAYSAPIVLTRRHTGRSAHR